MSSSNKDINEKMKLAPELRSPHARYPMNRPRWIRPTEEARTPKEDGAEATFLPHPKPPKGQATAVKPGYVWGPGSKGFGYYHLLTKESYAALAARMHSELAPTPTCCGGGSSKGEKADKDDLDHVYRFVVYPRSRCPVPKDSEAYNHGVQEMNVAHTNPEDQQWGKQLNPIKQGKVRL